MRFNFVDVVLEQTPERLVALKNVTCAEEYLADHFPGFPVLPGVFMVEAMVQAARRLLEGEGRRRYVLGAVRAVRYGSFVRPGEALRVEVTIDERLPDGAVVFRGTGQVVRPGVTSERPDTAVSGRFTMRAMRQAVTA